MLKYTLQEIYIGLGLGLMILLVKQVYALPPRPMSILDLAFSNDSSQLLYLSNRSYAKRLRVNFINAKTGEATGSTKLSVRGFRLTCI